MGRAIGVLILLFGVAVAVGAQVSPRPVADQEIRDNNSIRMRSIQLERVKLDSKKVVLSGPSKEQIAKLSEIKDDFENIQKLQDKIVKTYRTGKVINYSKIADSAATIVKKALRLEQNLFGAVPERATLNDADAVKSRGVRDLIIELDNAIGNFINSPIFESGKLVDTSASAKSDRDLQKIIRLSEALSAEAKKKS